MKYKWLNKKDNDRLIIFFNGWGMDEGVVKHLDFGDFDVVMFYDYNNLDTDFTLDKKYYETNIIAWSMGVMAVNAAGADFGNISKTVFINGTLKPIDEKYGIPPKIYDITISGFSESGRSKFVKNMGLRVSIDDNCSTLFRRTLENQKSELIALKNYKANLKFKPTKVYISDNDRIIPTKSQCAFWGIEPSLKGGHCPFFNFKKWEELL